MTDQPNRADRRAAKKTAPKSFAEMRAGAKPAEAVVNVCMRAHLVAEHELLDDRLVEAVQAKVSSLAGNGAAELREQVEALEAEIRENTYPFRLRAMGRRAFNELVAAHPPRRDEQGEIVEADLRFSANVDTLLPELIRACVYDPAPEDAGWDSLLSDDADDRLTDGQYLQLGVAAWNLNRRSVDVPFSLGVSMMSKASAAG